MAFLEEKNLVNSPSEPIEKLLKDFISWNDEKENTNKNLQIEVEDISSPHIS